MADDPSVSPQRPSAGHATDDLYVALGEIVSGPVKSDQMYRALGELEKKLTARLDASDKAVELLHADQVRVPTMLDREIMHVRDVIVAHTKGMHDLFMEKFSGVNAQFIALATLTDKLSLANATALTAALSAAEKAVSEQNRSSSLAITKSEQGMLEALKQLQTNFQTEIKGIIAVITTLPPARPGGGSGGRYSAA